MPGRIEDYALIGDCHTAALVGRDGSIDWLCFPRFDSPACFAALLGTPDHGRWRIAPTDEPRIVRRAYRGDTLVLDTTFETDSGAVTLTDFMPIRYDQPDLVRIARGVGGRVRLRAELIARFDYGSVTPWVRPEAGGVRMTAGPETVHVRTPVGLRREGAAVVGEFEVSEGDEVPFVLNWHPSHLESPPLLDPHTALADTEEWWRAWVANCTYRGEWREAVTRSLITLKALTYSPTGGIVAAPTTSLPEQIGGPRNWDYRYCWLRDATFTLAALLQCGFKDEARAWRDWLLRAVAGRGDELQIMYGLAGERRLGETTLPWLPGYEGSRPVRTGNGAYNQFQLDVFGEVMDCLHLARRSGMTDDGGWRIERELLARLEEVWPEADEGIWEVRGPRQHFTHSKVMAWVAFDRAVKDVERFGLPGPVERWRRLRDDLHAEVCTRGWNPDRGCFTQHYGGTEVDAALLMMAEVGFLPADDPRIAGTVAAVERELMRHGFVERYRTESGVDGLPAGEGAFLLCSFWLADNYALAGRTADARQLFERLLAVRNDVGLLAEEYDPVVGRQLGNFPQAFSHLGLINTARNLTQPDSPTAARSST
ncbi:MAG: glycoside hydrolase family 15 protein [Fimbriiglobus sp.]|jgi:GH15 family glucan-1,4-alpha-glucosidase|nr:glycoside hydrolase family 15 protein [Fimbriiglobus sp.]